MKVSGDENFQPMDDESVVRETLEHEWLFARLCRNPHNIEHYSANRKLICTAILLSN
jgi:hypothetical protein